MSGIRMYPAFYKKKGWDLIMKRLYTAESVTEGHPDKLCDLIADSILDECLKFDPESRVACEVLATKGMILAAGEITSTHEPYVFGIMKKVLSDVGYCADNIQMDALIHQQSPDIARAVECSREKRCGLPPNQPGWENGAGDQGVMIGYACDETPQFLPMPVVLANRIVRELAASRRSHFIEGILPDGKAQVTVEYDENGVPARLDAVVLSTQHDPEVTQEQIHTDVKKYIFDEILPAEMVDENTKFFINPTGRFVIGGPNGDSGVTGRKIIVDTYGGMARHGGGAFSGKDCTKVDRSAAYAARYVAKNIVAAGLADKCEIQLSYAIGVAQPTSIMIDTFGTGKLSEDKLVDIVRENFDLRPAGIIKMLDLRRPIYKQTAAYGHFGRHDLDLPWEKLDKVETLKAYL